jgi:hypothetical protein
MFKMSTKKDKTKRRGCLPILIALVFIFGSGIYFATEKIREAKGVEQTLIDRFDWAEKYTPVIDGSIPPQRMEGFIRVREAVQPHCVNYQAILKDIIDLEKLETDQASGHDKASRGMKSLKSIFSAGPKMVAFSKARNEALLAEEMGIGEYMYIYLTAYAEQLANESVSPYSGMEESRVSARARKEFVQILTNQLNALEATGHEPSHQDLLIALREEIEALSSGAHSAPWPNGPSGMAPESLAPYQQTLANLFCSGVVKIELLQKNRGFQLEG